jgi:hypothetical protein
MHGHYLKIMLVFLYKNLASVRRVVRVTPALLDSGFVVYLDV